MVLSAMIRLPGVLTYRRYLKWQILVTVLRSEKGRATLLAGLANPVGGTDGHSLHWVRSEQKRQRSDFLFLSEREMQRQLL